MTLTTEERAMLQEILDRVQIPGSQCRTYLTLREKLLGKENDDDEAHGHE